MCEQTPGCTAEQKEMLTVDEVKQIMRIGTNAAYNLVHSKSFPVINSNFAPYKTATKCVSTVEHIGKKNLRFYNYFQQNR